MAVKFDFRSELMSIAVSDVETLLEKAKSYGDSWKRRGGVGAFMMLARKWDRIENQCKAVNYDVFDAIYRSNGVDGLLDDIQDLRRYLTLVEHEHIFIQNLIRGGNGSSAAGDAPPKGYVDQG